MNTLSKLRVLLIGHGHLGKWHAEKAMVISDGEPRIRFVGIAEKNKDMRERLKTVYPHLKIVEDYCDILDEIDAALIVTPTSMHYQIAKDLLMAGKHVFCEKPICTDLKEAQELVNISEEKKLIFQVGHSERFHKIFNENENSFIKEFLTSPFIFHATRVAPFKGRALDVDVVTDVMIHDLDLLLYFLPSSIYGRPYKIEAHGFKMRTKYYDRVTAFMTYKNGSRAVIEASRNATSEIRSIEISGEKGELYLDLLNNRVREASSKSDGTSSSPFVSEWIYEKRDHLYLEQKAFYGAILDGEKNLVTAKEGMEVLELISYILKSLEEGRELIIA